MPNAIILTLTLALAAAGMLDEASPALQTAAPAQEPSPLTGGNAEEVLGFERDKTSRMTVPVTIDGHGPYRFLVDTGAERTVISRELARKLNLAGGAGVRLHSVTEASDVGTFVIPSLQVSKKPVSGINAPGLAEIHLGADGMLGVDSLKSQQVVFDFANQTMTVSQSSRRAARIDRDVIVVTGRNLYGRLILADARVDGQRVWVIIDTGSEATIGNEALRRALAKRKRLPPTIPTELMSVTGGRISADVGMVKGLVVGGVTLKDLAVAFADVHPFRKLGLTDRPALLLGMNALKAFDRVSIDFANRKVRFLLPGHSSLEPNTRLAVLHPAGSSIGK